MHPLLRFYKWLGLSLLALLGVVLVSGTLLTALSWRRDPAPALLRVDARPVGPVFIGTPVEYRVLVSCPYYRLPARPFQVTLPEGGQSVNVEKRRLAGLGFFTWRWSCRTLLQPYELGRKEGGKMTVAFSDGRRAAADSVTAVLPALEVQPRRAKAGGPLTVSPQLPASLIRDKLRWWHFVALAVLVAALAWAILSLFRQRELLREALPPLPPWELARLAMQEIEDRLPLDAELFFVELTDILRGYCEARFQLRAAKETTPEFLVSIGGNPMLTAEERHALADFLAAADEVKFAKGDATQEQLLSALRTARQFVTDTIPPPPLAGGESPAANRNPAAATELGEAPQPSSGSDAARPDDNLGEKR